MITYQMSRPVLEIKHNNFASKKVALKSGYALVRHENPYEIYEYQETRQGKAF